MKTKILKALESFVNQRPGFNLREYASLADYRADQRPVEKQLKAAREMLRYIMWHDSITASHIVNATRHKRISIKINGDKVTIDYTVGQCFPTEYRKAVCMLLQSVLWDYWRDNDPSIVTAADIYKKAKKEFRSKYVTDLFKG